MPITNRTRNSVAFKKLLKHPLVEECEGEGMDEGRFFVHLVPGYIHPDGTHSFSVSGAAEALKGLREVTKCYCADSCAAAHAKADPK
jgi:hypothetical protein